MSENSDESKSADSGEPKGSEGRKAPPNLADSTVGQHSYYGTVNQNYERGADGKWTATNPGNGSDALKPAVARKAELSDTWFESKGYAGENQEEQTERLEHGKPSIGAFFYNVEAKSALSYDLDKAELELMPIQLEAQASLLHGEAAKKLNVSRMVDDLFGGSTTAVTGAGAEASMAARVGDPTGHGTPLGPGVGSHDVWIGGRAAWRGRTDFHGCPKTRGDVPDVGGVVAVGAPTVWINYMPACRAGDVVVEVPGGPNPIVSGCPTVMIGSPVVPTPAAPPEPGVEAEVGVTGDMLTAKAEAEFSIKRENGKFVGEAKAGVMAAVFHGSISGKFTIPLPHGHKLMIGATAEGSLLAAGAEAEYGFKHADGGGWETRAGTKVGAGLAGLGLNFTMGFQ